MTTPVSRYPVFDAQFNTDLFASIVSRYQNYENIPLQLLIYAWGVALITNNNIIVLNTAQEADANANRSTELNQFLSSLQSERFKLNSDAKATDALTLPGYVADGVRKYGYSIGTVQADGTITMTVGDLDGLIENIKTKVDTLSNISQKVQLRLQQAMGTANTGTETSTNLMQKVFSGIDRITSNLAR